MNKLKRFLFLALKYIAIIIGGVWGLASLIMLGVMIYHWWREWLGFFAVILGIIGLIWWAAKFEEWWKRWRSSNAS